MNVSEKLKKLRHQQKMTATYVSTQLGIAKSTLSNYENGTRTPKAQILSRFAEFYNTSLDYLFDVDKSTYGNIAYNRAVNENTSIPILGAINSTEPLISAENTIGYTDLGCEYKGKGEYFALYVRGDSMNNSRICEGDIVIVRKQSKVETGEIAVVLIEGEDATVKKVFFTHNTITLMPSSTNLVHKARIIDTKITKVEILGKVVEVKIKL